MENGEKLYIKMMLEDLKNQLSILNKDINNINSKIIELSQIDHKEIDNRIREIEKYIATLREAKIYDTLKEIEKMVSALNVKAGIWGLVGGLLVAIGSYIISKI